MCLSTEALSMFLSLLALETITFEQARITIHTPDHDQHWIASEDEWCTDMPSRELVAYKYETVI